MPPLGNISVTIPSDVLTAMFYEHAEWDVPEEFTVTPLNALASLIRWRVLCMIMNHLPESQREEFKSDHDHT